MKTNLNEILELLPLWSRKLRVVGRHMGISQNMYSFIHLVRESADLIMDVDTLTTVGDKFHENDVSFFAFYEALQKVESAYDAFPGGVDEFTNLMCAYRDYIIKFNGLVINLRNEYLGQ